MEKKSSLKKKTTDELGGNRSGSTRDEVCSPGDDVALKAAEIENQMFEQEWLQKLEEYVIVNQDDELLDNYGEHNVESKENATEYPDLDRIRIDDSWLSEGPAERNESWGDEVRNADQEPVSNWNKETGEREENWDEDGERYMKKIADVWGVGREGFWGDWGAENTRDHDVGDRNWGSERAWSSEKSEDGWGKEKFANIWGQKKSEDRWGQKKSEGHWGQKKLGDRWGQANEEDRDCNKGEGKRNVERVKDYWGHNERDTHPRDWDAPETDWSLGSVTAWSVAGRRDAWGDEQGQNNKEERNEDYWGVGSEELDWGKKKEEDWCVERERGGRADTIWSWSREARARLTGTKKTTGRRKRKAKVVQKFQTSDEQKSSPSPDDTAPNATPKTKAAQKFQASDERGRSQPPDSTVQDIKNDSNQQIHSIVNEHTSSPDTDTGGQNILEYVVGNLEKKCVELEAALNWVNGRRQDAMDEDLDATDKDLSTDIANLKKLMSDVKRSRKEVILCYSNMTGLTNKLPAKSVALLDLTMELKDRAKRVVNIVKDELYGSEKGKFKEVFFKMMDRLGKHDGNKYLGAFCEMQTRMAKDHDVEEYIYEFMREYKNTIKMMKKTQQSSCSTST